MAYTIKGVDLSHNNGKVNWNALKDAGTNFAYIKATEGVSFVDPLFDYNRGEAHRVGIEVGAYHFMRAADHSDLQAAHFLKVVGKLQKGERIPAIDVEHIADAPDWGSLDKATRIARVQHWLDIVNPISQAAFKDNCLFYTSPAWFRGWFTGANFSKNKLWAARYSNKEPDLTNTNWTTWHIWQYSDKGTIPGVAKDSIDMNWQKSPLLA